jgi:hypothetical protein
MKSSLNELVITIIYSDCRGKESLIIIVIWHKCQDMSR